MTTASQRPPPIHNFLITIPRTASNLVTQLLNLPAQPSIIAHPKDGYFFLPALGYRYKHDIFSKSVLAQINEKQSGMHAALQTSFSAYESWINNAEHQGKGTFIKEHINWTISPAAESHFLYPESSAEEPQIPRNPSIFPDIFLSSRIRATFLIRHPALTFPSLFRTVRDNEGLDALLSPSAEKVFRWEATFHWHIALYRFLGNYLSPSLDPNVTYPIVIDASDLSDPVLVRKYASAVGLDPALVRFEWERSSDEGLEKVERRMKDTLLGSRGVVAGKLVDGQDVDLGVEKGKWKEEFGEVVGERLGGLVDAALADWEWLWARRLSG